ncbi:hypothetical protein KAFR_0I01400 [Kazachstania africana CBS 2517]|uniref:Major facilitator superfamily (MFS) profile domain-containing protein n=1 Tax=Kazachstania africana (strain ATCC 22294 / BCRC 22015 / CBS 2517 / CECT 1963 / NBRC 1671 / NRRL Y-8276) TaxID=1071382 RepID=H2AZX1_KAZAF|nr:hypothetical protein KAFR_0I01400 [Kazachstania africana CBS 2517]CCF59921.1 hypothetical protein KAFR_0I01400 [Kazachstania africana CBS 2517]
MSATLPNSEQRNTSDNPPIYSTSSTDSTFTSEPEEYRGRSHIYSPGSSPTEIDHRIGEYGAEQISKFGSQSESNVQVSRRLSRILTCQQYPRDVKEEEEEEPPSYEGLPPMGDNRPYPPLLPNKEQYEVTFNGPDDPLHPFNWSLARKIIPCFILCLNCICITLGSAIYASGVLQICAEFHIIQVVAILGITLYVLGFAASPVIFAPLSEVYGRKGVLVVSAFGFTIFNFAVATAKDLQTLLICRFFAGFIGAAPLAVVPAAFADIFDTNVRGKAICLFSLGVFVGPILGPVIGSYIVQHTTWRWLEYVVGCLSAVVFVLVTFFYQESHHPTILAYKAKQLRRQTNNWGIHAAQESVELSIKDICEKTMTRPIYMLFTEPILLIVTIYNSFVYGLLYLLLEAYPIVFVEGYGFITNGELPYIALIIGMLVCGAFIWYMDDDYLRRYRKKGGLVPEARLIPMIVGGIVFPIGILWFCWTGNYPNRIHWSCPTIAGSFIGFGLMGIFLPCLNYIIESYLYIPASAVAANTFMRSAFGAAFPLFAGYMFRNMGTGWAGLLLGLFAASMIPVPLLLLRYGEKIRKKSKYAYSG